MVVRLKTEQFRAENTCLSVLKIKSEVFFCIISINYLEIIFVVFQNTN